MTAGIVRRGDRLLRPMGPWCRARSSRTAISVRSWMPKDWPAAARSCPHWRRRSSTLPSGCARGRLARPGRRQRWSSPPVSCGGWKRLRRICPKRC